jgi:hypothetical protein
MVVPPQVMAENWGGSRVAQWRVRQLLLWHRELAPVLRDRLPLLCKLVPINGPGFIAGSSEDAGALRQRGDAADALFREMVRRAGKD